MREREMTHTLHRQGGEDLQREIIILAIAARETRNGDSARKFERFADVVLRYNPVSIGDMANGNCFNMELAELRRSFKAESIVHAVFQNPAVAACVLKELKNADIGLSIVVTGLLEQTRACCAEAGLTPHTVAQSLGIFGRTDKLPDKRVLEVATMCGHGLISFALILHFAAEIRARKCTPEEAAERMARMCQCGVFNPGRAGALLQEMAS
jgi:hypothetical protein